MQRRPRFSARPYRICLRERTCSASRRRGPARPPRSRFPCCCSSPPPEIGAGRVRRAHWCWRRRVSSPSRSMTTFATTAQVRDCARRSSSAGCRSIPRWLRCPVPSTSWWQRRGAFWICASRAMSASLTSPTSSWTRRTACSTWGSSTTSGRSSTSYPHVANRCCSPPPCRPPWPASRTSSCTGRRAWRSRRRLPRSLRCNSSCTS